MGELYVKIRWILKDPVDFFIKAREEVHLREAALYLMILTFISSMLGYLMRVSTGWNVGLLQKRLLLSVPFVGTGGVKFAQLALLGIFILIAASFVGAFILKVWLRLFRVRASYDKAYQLLAYAWTPNYLFGWIHAYASWASLVWVLALLVIGTKGMFDVSKKKAVLMFVVPLVIIGILYGLILFWIARALA